MTRLQFRRGGPTYSHPADQLKLVSARVGCARIFFRCDESPSLARWPRRSSRPLRRRRPRRSLHPVIRVSGSTSSKFRPPVAVGRPVPCTPRPACRATMARVAPAAQVAAPCLPRRDVRWPRAAVMGRPLPRSPARPPQREAPPAAEPLPASHPAPPVRAAGHPLRRRCSRR